MAILLGGAWWWRSTPAPPCWMDIRKGEGSILSLATGRDPDGNEIVVAAGYCRTDNTGRDLRVVCYDAANGHVRWEVREDQALPEMMIHPTLAIDPAGDVFAGCGIAAARVAKNKAISKYSGQDGRLLWVWKLESYGEEAFIKAIPLPNQKGGVWISGIHEGPEGYRRFIAVLNPKTGDLVWLKDLNPATDGFDDPVRIHTLRDGSAILMFPHADGEETSTGLIQCRSHDGEIKWQYQPPEGSGLFGADLPMLVDEPMGQTVLSLMSPIGVPEHHFVALDLATGNERWHVRTPLVCRVSDLTPRRDGDMELWSTDQIKISHTEWWHWKMDHGIPSPIRKARWIEQPLLTTLSSGDGSIMKKESFGHRTELVLARLTKPGTAVVNMVILSPFENNGSKPSRGPWRAAKIDSKSRVGFFARQPGGNETCDSFPEHATLTPSGQLAIAGDPTEHKLQWQIRVW